MRLVSEQSKAEVNRRRALDRMKPALRRLTANLMRISRGAGHPHRLANEMADCLEAMNAHWAAAECGPSSEEIQRAIDPDAAQAEFRPWAAGTDEDRARWEANGTFDIDYATKEIRRASLQMAASMLVDQLLLVRKAEADMSDAIRHLEAARETRRAHFQALAGTPGRKRSKAPV
ncbi:hypothetical protein [Methylobacterium sp. J-090]|uniref:hypothetical protein n=1 Tax=Methylobacterium sp. J-090 TaxID=2836666 RepID=UPI001FB9971A|nr:hypothetical protein [Methylobacterium sp. J-090]MCJ2080179.1 hypothetical protein [Methylobacterium sp. J-090]